MTFGPEEKMRFLFALRSAGLMESGVLQAMESIDRADFIEGHFAERAYEDRPLPISCGQTISQPSIVGLMTEALEVGKRHKVLEVGTGSGYQAAILAKLARRVYTVERHPYLVRAARARLEALNLTNVTVMLSDGCFGLPEQAPFDRILVTAAPEDPPGPLMAQLRVGGVMVLPVGQSDSVQQLIRVRRSEEGYAYEDLADVRFVPLLEGVSADVG